MLLASFPRLFARRFFGLCAALSATVTLFAQTPSAADGFDPDIDGNVYALATQPDGKVVVGGQFTTVQGFGRNNLARLNPDGTLDHAFNPNANAPVRAILVQPDGRIVIGGDFTELLPNVAASAVERSRLARLNADGTVDPSFIANITGEPLPGGDTLKAQVFALARQPDGSILVGGSFAGIQPGNLAVIYNRRNLLRLNSAGGLDQAFDPNPNATVLSLAPHVDNTIIVGGGFTSFHPAGAAAAITRNRIARLSANGSVDPAFDPNANNGVTSLAVQRDGRIVIGGYFTTLQPPEEENPFPQTHLARINIDGSVDWDFHPRVEGDVAAIELQPDGSIVVGGLFSAAWGRATGANFRSNVARFYQDGSLDPNFAPVLNGAVAAIATQPDGKVVLGGYFTRAQPQGATAVLVRNHIARLNAGGSIDANFELVASGRILASVSQADGKIVVGGTFTSMGGATHNYLARLNADGTVDEAYTPDLNGRVYTLAYEPASGKVIVGGEFTTIDGVTRNRIGRVNPDGTLDSEFNPSINGRVGAIVLQPDGRILVGGTFTTVQPVGATSTTNRSNVLRLNANGTLDTAFDPSANSAVSAIALQPDGKVILGGLFSAVAPGLASNSSAGISGRNFLARFNADGTLDNDFSPNPNGQVSTIVVQADNKIVIGGAFTGMAPPGATVLTVRNHIARINADGTIDAEYDPNADNTVLTSTLQPDGKLLIGGSFLILKPGGEEGEAVLRKYVARLNTDGTVDPSFDLDIDEAGGNRVDSLRVLPDGGIFIGGNFSSLHPAGTPDRITRPDFVRLAPDGTIDTSFNPGAGGSTGAVVNAFAIQPDGRVIAVGNFSDLGGSRSTNIARFLPEGVADTSFSSTLTTDGPVNAVAIRPNGAPVSTQLAGFAWLNNSGTLLPAFNPTTQLSGQINAIAIQPDGRVLLGGSFANLSATTAGNLVRFNPNGTLDTSFNPEPNGPVTAIAIQGDGRIIIVGSFTTVDGVARNRIARLDHDGTLETTFNPSANSRINAVLVQPDGRIVIGGTFTSLSPNATETPVARNYLARLNSDGTLDTAYNPSPNFIVNALAMHTDSKVIAVGGFTSVQPNGSADIIARNGIARFDPDGMVDQNFNPNVNGVVNAVVTRPGEPVIIGGAFTTIQPGATGTAFARNNLARLHENGTVDETFNPSPNGAVLTLARQPDGALLAGGTFTTLRPAGSVAVARHNIARINPDGSLDLGFNPNLNGGVSVFAAHPDGGVLVGGSFNAIQLNGSIVIGGSFASVGGIPARNLAGLNDDGSVNANFQPRPDGAVNAILVQLDGKVTVGGAFTQIAGAARDRLARFNDDGTLDTAFNPVISGEVSALALQSDGKVLVGLRTGSGQPPRRVIRLNPDGSLDATFTGPASMADGTGEVTALAVQPDGRVLVMTQNPIHQTAINVLFRLNADGSQDPSFPLVDGTGNWTSLALQADGRIIISGQFSAVEETEISNLARLNPDGSIDASFRPTTNGRVTAVALQADGRVMIGGSFTTVSGETRVGIARLAATEPAIQILGVGANGTVVIWNRAWTTVEVSAVRFDISTDRFTWTELGEGTRIAGSGSDWQLTGVTLPSSGTFYIRARALAPSGGTSSGIIEMVRQFNYSDPLAGASGTVAQVITPDKAAAPAIALDPITGIAARSTVMMVPGEGSVEIIATPAEATGEARLANLSTRGRVTAENPLILGFAISGSESRPVLVRAIGPGLAGFGVNEAISAARLEVYDASGAIITANEGWAGAANLVQAAVATGAFPLTADSADSAALLTLEPGTYSMHVRALAGTASENVASGVALAEIYDAGHGAGSRLVNVSSRGAAGSGSDALISGFVIAGADASSRVLLRGIGPGLTRFGAMDVVTDPSVALFDSTGQPLGANDNWVSSLTTVSSAAVSAGAFALEAGSRDAAVLATLPRGAYTIQVSAGTTGTALLEIYEVP